VVHAGTPGRLGEPLDISVGHRAGRVHGGGRQEGTQRGHHTFGMIIGGTEADRKQPREQLPVQTFRDERQRRRGEQRRVERETPGRLLAGLRVDAEHLGRVIEGVREESAVGGGDGVQPVGEGGDDAEVASPAAQRPQEVRMVGAARLDYPAICGDDLGLDEVIAGKARQPVQPADPAAEGEAGDAGRPDHAAGRRQAMALGRGVELFPGQPGRRDRDAGGGIDRNRP
jgi:hypothetical protein